MLLPTGLSNDALSEKISVGKALKMWWFRSEELEVDEKGKAETQTFERIIIGMRGTSHLADQLTVH